MTAGEKDFCKSWWLIAGCALFISLSLAASARAAAQYDYIATMKTEWPRERGEAIVAGSLTWNCQGNACRISGPWSTPGVSDCKALARRVGIITRYGYAGKWLNNEQLAACNEGGQEALPSPGVVQAPTGETGEASSSAYEEIQDASEAVRTGTTVLLGTYQWDVDSNRQEVTNAADLWLNHIDEHSFQLTPLNGARIALLGRSNCGDATPEQMAQGRYLTTPLVERNSFPLVGEGSVIGMITNSRKLAKLCVRGYKSSHDFGFAEADLLAKKWKDMVKEQPLIPRYHMVLSWIIYDQIDPFSLFEAPE